MGLTSCGGLAIEHEQALDLGIAHSHMACSMCQAVQSKLWLGCIKVEMCMQCGVKAGHSVTVTDMYMYLDCEHTHHFVIMKMAVMLQLIATHNDSV